MRKCFLALYLALLLTLCACAAPTAPTPILATTRPVYDFTTALCAGTDLKVELLISDSISCLHDYALSTEQMRSMEAAELVFISGAGLEDFAQDILSQKQTIDCSQGISMLECDHTHEHEHAADAHIWLAPENAKIMAKNICIGLSNAYPQHKAIFETNLAGLAEKLAALQAYGQQQLSSLSCRELITFHDGFGYLAHAFDLTLLSAIEEESGSEASAKELISLIHQVRQHKLPAIFVEINGSPSAAGIISKETGVEVFVLDMCMSGDNYFTNMYRNIDTLKEALE